MARRADELRGTAASDSKRKKLEGAKIERLHGGGWCPDHGHIEFSLHLLAILQPFCKAKRRDTQLGSQ